MASYTRVSDADKFAMLMMREGGHSYQQIADHFSRDIATVYYICRPDKAAGKRAYNNRRNDEARDEWLGRRDPPGAVVVPCMLGRARRDADDESRRSVLSPVRDGAGGAGNRRRRPRLLTT